MKKILEKMKTYSFWVSFAGAVIIFASCLGKAFNFEFDSSIIEEVILAFAGILVVLGIVTKDNKQPKEEDTKEVEKSKDIENNDNDKIDKNDKIA